jgi:hypothetical protein
MLRLYATAIWVTSIEGLYLDFYIVSRKLCDILEAETKLQGTALCLQKTLFSQLCWS